MCVDLSCRILLFKSLSDSVVRSFAERREHERKELQRTDRITATPNSSCHPFHLFHPFHPYLPYPSSHPLAAPPSSRS